MQSLSTNTAERCCLHAQYRTTRQVHSAQAHLRLSLPHHTPFPQLPASTLPRSAYYLQEFSCSNSGLPASVHMRHLITHYAHSAAADSALLHAHTPPHSFLTASHLGTALHTAVDASTYPLSTLTSPPGCPHLPCCCCSALFSSFGSSLLTSRGRPASAHASPSSCGSDAGVAAAPPGLLLVTFAACPSTCAAGGGARCILRNRRQWRTGHDHTRKGELVMKRSSAPLTMQSIRNCTPRTRHSTRRPLL